MTTETTATLIAKAIQEAERTRKWTADKAGIADATLRRKLAGGTDFTTNEVIRVAKALGVHPADLLPSEFARAA